MARGDLKARRAAFSKARPAARRRAAKSSTAHVSFKVKGRIGGGFVSDGEDPDLDDPHRSGMLNHDLASRSLKNVVGVLQAGRLTRKFNK